LWKEKDLALVRQIARSVFPHAEVDMSVQIAVGIGPAQVDSPSQPAQLEIFVTWTDGVVLMLLAGELAISSVAVLERRIGELATEVKEGDLFLDLSRLTYIDSAGIAFLMRAHKKLTSRAIRLVIVFPSTHVRRVFDICGLTSVVAVMPQ
jgi:anti-anti-sigma factor